MRRLLTASVPLIAFVPAVALACKPLDPEAVFQAAREQAQLLWFWHLGITAVILLLDLRARKLSRAGIFAIATSVLHPWWLLPSAILPLGCLELKQLAAQACLAIAGGLLARRILAAVRKQTA